MKCWKNCQYHEISHLPGKVVDYWWVKRGLLRHTFHWPGVEWVWWSSKFPEEWSVGSQQRQSFQSRSIYRLRVRTLLCTRSVQKQPRNTSYFALKKMLYLNEKVGNSNVIVEWDLVINSISLGKEVINIDNSQKLRKIEFIILTPHSDSRLNGQRSSNNGIIGFYKLKMVYFLSQSFDLGKVRKNSLKTLPQ